MSLRHILLGALSEPASGYDLKNDFSGGMRLFWSAELAQIYPELKKMEAAGLVSSEQQPSSKGPPRRVYRRTAEGLDVLREWLIAGPDFGVERNAMIAQIFFLGALPGPDRSAFLVKLRASFEDKLAALNAIESQWAQSDPRFPDSLPIDELTRHFALIAGQRRMAMMIDWCDDCAQRLASNRYPTAASSTIESSV